MILCSCVKLYPQNISDFLRNRDFDKNLVPGQDPEDPPAGSLMAMLVTEKVIKVITL